MKSYERQKEVHKFIRAPDAAATPMRAQMFQMENGSHTRYSDQLVQQELTT